MEVTDVVIVGAGPSGLATSACLTKYSIPHIILEKHDCNVSLWRKHTYDRVNLHLAKEFCSLPLMPHSPSSPTFLSKAEFLNYIDNYVSHFNISPRYNRMVDVAVYDEAEKKWKIETTNTQVGERREAYVAKYVVVATGENNEEYIPEVSGLDSFEGEIVHSKNYKCGSKYKGKEVLVVGCGNSGMEIAYDLNDFEARTSIVIRNPVHLLTKDLVHQGMSMLKYLPTQKVDTVIMFLANLEYGDLSEFGIHRPEKGPFYLKKVTGRSPVIDIGTIRKIRDGEIKVVPSAIKRIEKKKVVFENNMEKDFDVIVFATGFKSIANTWLKDYKYVLNEEGMAKNEVPKHWKGEKGIYCAGLSRRGLFGVSMDAEAIADDINLTLKLAAQPSSLP
ncbi:probable indole-3-pyruvate monooxygenase YUCCA10 [Prosopis cineraria]|uniref:probable indole-3-pyruvate monooxygenase YUCCA10 n=1 Tax=Prosopis cineraria TaxID=364024 RepID=UPI00240F2FEC|nr:probable indole-3-pyruvate monooxygenase YUCCA10 [Prosopis cineraria]XP_054795843.1 probable indole-3-pyruvate monooxygenase YUCCA10 [Prosopis cineraria]